VHSHRAWESIIRTPSPPRGLLIYGSPSEDQPREYEAQGELRDRQPDNICEAY